MDDKNLMKLAASFLAGAAVAAIVAFLVIGKQGGSVQQAQSGAAAAAMGKDIDYEAVFPSWNADSESIRELVAFVADCTDKTSANYIDPADRIATFDMDGTLISEKAPIYVDYCLTMYRILDDPNHEASPEEINSMQQVRDHAYADGTKFYPEGLTKHDIIATTFAGMTPQEFRDYVTDFAEKTEVVGFEGMTYAQSFFKPMQEVVNYLKANDFDVWVVSACEREVTRAMVALYGIPYDHVVATDVPYVATGLGDQAANKYNMGQDEKVVLGAPLEDVACEKSAKPSAIAREIGKQPVLAFGNSSGDYSMLNYAEGNPDHPGMGFLVVCDDTEREYGNAEKAAEYYAEVEKESWTSFSMANDWKTIYGEDVKKTQLPGAAAQTESGNAQAAGNAASAAGDVNAAAQNIDYAASFPSWNADSASLKELVAFVADCTDETSANYLEPEDRIATFDMDGTVICEKAPVYVDYCMTIYRVLKDPTYEASEEERLGMQQIFEHAYTDGSIFTPEEGLDKQDCVAKAFAGMTPEEFRDYVVNYVDNTNVVGFKGMTYGQSFYKPMIEVIDYLRANDFDVWMVSACEREVVRAIMERYDIPYDHVVATDVTYVASGLGEEAADKYNMGQDEEIVLGDVLEGECGKSAKSAAIAREIGKRPVLAFGNSSGDYSMLNYAEGNPNHPGMACFVVCDDTEREYGSDEKAAGFYEVVEKEGWTAFSMANDWKTIYGDDVLKTELPGVDEALREAEHEQVQSPENDEAEPAEAEEALPDAA